MSKKQKRFVSIVCMILAILMILSVLTYVISASVHAVTQQQIQTLKDQKAEITQRKNEVSVHIAELQQQQASVLEQKAALDEQNELTRQEIDVINQQIDLYERMIATKEVQLEDAIEAEEAQLQAYRKHMRAMEENGLISYIEILFQSKSFADLLSRLGDISDIMSADKRLEDECIAAREHVQEVKADYEATQAEFEATKVELLETKRQLEADIEAAYKRIADLDADIEAAYEEYTENELAEAEFQAEIDKLMEQLRQQEEAERKRREEALRLQQQQQQSTGSSNVTVPAAPTVVTAAVGNFIWPYPQNNYVHSGYGMRMHPIFQEERMHYGIDIGGTAGQQIVAIAAGTVSVATNNASYGNYVMINHGDGTASLYAHMQSLAVSPGQTVTQGQTVGYCGSTGWATGPHLHFEIRVNGATTDPLAYYSAGTYIKGF